MRSDVAPSKDDCFGDDWNEKKCCTCIYSAVNKSLMNNSLGILMNNSYYFEVYL